jgi:subtilisin family serine protease
MKRRLFTLTAATILLAAMNLPEGMSAAPGQSNARGKADSNRTNNRYIVRMVDLPVSSYDGRIQARPATKPGRGQKIDPDSPAVTGYVGYLDSRHDEVLRRVGAGRKLYDYRYTFNGFTAEMTGAQAEALRRVNGVVSVTKDELQHADTSSTPTFLGLDASDGLWNQLGGTDDAGEDIVIGVIDSGIWPESQSFSDRVPKEGKAGKKDKKNDSAGDRLSYHHLPGWKGKCETGEAFHRTDCNHKLIGARRFNEAWGGDAGVEEERPWEFASPRDYNGHGTHTASTAGGNHGVMATGPASIFGQVSGIAPRARISVYKALWSTQDGSTASGFTSDLVAAIDQAVADGVDVINYSISGSTSNFLDAAEVAFLFAADAGVFVSASAGNSGPTTGTVAHPSPWITTVAAGTHNRSGLGSVTLGNGTTYTGPSLATALTSKPLIDSMAAGLPGANATALALCFTATDNGGTPVLDPAKVAGKIVVCDRGTNARINKSLAVRDAGGVGMILLNVTPGSLNADLHFVPTVHLADTDRAAVKAYAAGVNPTAVINQSTLVFDVPAPITAAFSSRGPLTAGGGDLLKPDVIAPGQDIVAAVAPPGNAGLSFNALSGTSMSAPHVAGLAALLKDLHEDWTPMMIKSALMTTGSDVIDGGVPAPNTNPVLIFRQGAGHVTPNAAADPGLVYNSGFNEWLAFLCGATTGVNPSTCSTLAGAGYSLNPSDLNVASIAIGNLAGIETIKRTVTNVGDGAATYTPVVTGMTGFTVDVSPSSLTIVPGQSKTFTVTFTRTTATLNAYTGGQLTWTDGRHDVRVPIVVRPVALAAPAQVFGTGGPISYNVTFGYTGPFSATPRGLIPATLTNGSVADDPADSFDPAGPGVTAIPVTIPAGTTHGRFSLFDANVTPPSDIDLYVVRNADDVLVGFSGSGTSNEEVNLVNPAAGSYTVYVHGFAVPGTANFTLFSWLLGSAAAGNMTVTAPTSATTGASGTISLAFNGLTPGTKYLGSVFYAGTAGLPNPTIVRVDP